MWMACTDSFQASAAAIKQLSSTCERSTFHMMAGCWVIDKRLSCRLRQNCGLHFAPAGTAVVQKQADGSHIRSCAHTHTRACSAGVLIPMLYLCSSDPWSQVSLIGDGSQLLLSLLLALCTTWECRALEACSTKSMACSLRRWSALCQPACLLRCG